MRPPPDDGPIQAFYVDDSGASQTGFITYSWIQFPARDHAAVDALWGELRRELQERYGVREQYTLHASGFARGKGTPSCDGDFNRSRRRRREAMRFLLAGIGDCRTLRVGTIYLSTDRKGRQYQAEKAGLYTRMISLIDSRLAAAGERAVMTVDGRGGRQCTPFYQGYRDADARHFAAPPKFRSTRRAPLLQVADLVAWTAYQSILRYPGKDSYSALYDAHLRHRDVHGGPRPL